MKQRLPFTISKTESFYEKLNEWIGDVFYDILPEAGFELRDEQIYMAFQLEKAFREKKVIFAEAGVGTGKTIVYLLYAILYARYTNRPAIIACADESLIEQLVKKEGDIQKLEDALNLDIDVRLAKSRDQYLCLKKLEEVKFHDDRFLEIYDDLPPFIFLDESMQKFTRYGDRKDYPQLGNDEWEKIAWDPLQDCLSCEFRHRCGQTLHRQYYREARDLIICSHDFYMEHVWTKESRKREGAVPFLPEYSSVVFDEGHLLEYACQKALTYRFTEGTLHNLLSKLMQNDVRETTLYTIEHILEQNEQFFHELSKGAIKNPLSEKQWIKKNEEILSLGKELLTLLHTLEEELVFEGEMYTIPEYDLKIVEEFLDQITYSLSLFLKEIEGIIWFEEINDERTLVIMPRMVEDFMEKEVFSEKKPFIFSSATLSENESFDYLAKSLGIRDFLSFSVESPFDYEKQMSIYMPTFQKQQREEKFRFAADTLIKHGGGTLVLFQSLEDLETFKQYIPKDVNFPVYFEGEGEISTLISNFQREKDACLCAVHLWEGLDVPGEALRNVIIFQLPFPPNDPVMEAKREGAKDPFQEVDMPYMLLRLRQGIGRLIRSKEDKGNIYLYIDEGIDEGVLEKIKAVLPTEVKKFS